MGLQVTCDSQRGEGGGQDSGNEHKSRISKPAGSSGFIWETQPDDMGQQRWHWPQVISSSSRQASYAPWEDKRPAWHFPRPHLGEARGQQLGSLAPHLCLQAGHTLRKTLQLSMVITDAFLF